MPPNSCDRSLDCRDHGFGVRAVGLDGQRPHAEALAAVRGLAGLVRLADVGQRDVGAFAGQPLDDGGTDAAAAAGDQRTLVVERGVHELISRMNSFDETTADH